MQPDRTIPFYNIILRCSRWERQPIRLPEGYAIRSYLPGDEKAWAEMETAVGDFDSAAEAEEYFCRTYLSDPAKAGERCFFAADPQGCVIGSCLAWHDDRRGTPAASLHWLIVDEACRRKGIGRALCLAVMNAFAERGELPVYVHTQPWSWPAVLLYLHLGFRWQRTDTFSHYENQYEQAMCALEEAAGAETAAFCRSHSDP